MSEPQEATVNSAPLVYKVAEVARKLRTGKSTINDAIKRGDIPAIRFGRTVRVPAVWVHAQIER